MKIESLKGKLQAEAKNSEEAFKLWEETANHEEVNDIEKRNCKAAAALKW